MPTKDTHKPQEKKAAPKPTIAKRFRVWLFGGEGTVRDLFR